MGIGLVYWLIVILPQRSRAWHLLDAATGDDQAAASASPAASAGAA